jgi:NAD(P)-dependent dehydrogenase (short-subunit alcohol dehydrogenase family)
VEAEHGRLDILVNNAANAVERTTMPGGFWEKPLAAVDLITVGLHSHFVSAYYAAPLLIANGRGLIVHTGHYGAVAYYHGPAYGAQKAGADKMAALKCAWRLTTWSFLDGLPKMSNSYCLPGRAGGTPDWISRTK